MSIVGAVLLLAVAMSVLVHVAHTRGPEWGETAERDWDEAVSIAMREFAGGASRSVDGEDAFTIVIPPAPVPNGMDWSLLGRVAPDRAQGSIAFEPTCARFTATHESIGEPPVRDIVNGSAGCIVFTGQNAYSPPFTYRFEFGGVLRMQHENAGVVTPPHLDLNRTTGTSYRVALVLPALRGPAVATSGTDVGNRVDLTPAGGNQESVKTSNAANVTWTVESAHPAAWQRAFNASFTRAAFVENRASPGPGESAADYAVTCDPVDCSLGADGLGKVVVTIEGPRTDSNDLQFSFSYGVYDVTLH